MVTPLNIHVMVLHQHVHDLVGVRSAVVDVADHMQIVDSHALDQAAQRLNEGRALPDLNDGRDDVAIIFLLVVLLATGVQKLVDDVAKIGRQRLAHLGIWRRPNEPDRPGDRV